MSRLPKSLRFYVILPIIVITLATTVSLAIYEAKLVEQEELSFAQDNALILANSIDAGISTMEDLSPEKSQEIIDSLTTANPATSEFNIILLEGEGSTIIASNEPGNIEETDEEEHEALLSVLADDEPVAFIDRDDAEPEEDPEEAAASESDSATSPDELQPFRQMPRFVSLTAPIHVEGKTVGAINVKLTLVSMEEHLRQLQFTYLIAAVLASLCIVLTVDFLLKRYVLNPVQRLRVGTRDVTSGELSTRIQVTRPDEIGELTTDFNTMASTLEADALEIAQLEQMRDDLTSMIVHDMKIHLQVIDLYLGLIQESRDTFLTPKQLLQVSRIQQATDNLQNMVLNLLSIRKLESGQMDLDMRPVDVQRLVDDAVNAVNFILEEHQQTVQTNIAEYLPAIPADPELIHRVLVNLLTNAIKFSKEGSVISVWAELTNQHLELRVNDEGEGIALEDQKRIFEKFTHASSRIDGGRTETGLGLAFCKLAVEAHQGSICVESPIVDGHGSSFIVQLPWSYPTLMEDHGS
ncbi:MAG: HAMP domain-containing protein [Anaerolineales bacterium]|nr:HAMP domain-containing protein [Anaerolineales bacterium]